MGQTLREATTVVVVGAGAAGLTAASLLRRCGVECIVLERQARGYVEQRQRAGIVEYRAVRMFENWGLAQRVLGDFPSASTLEFRVDGESHVLGLDDFSKGCPARLCPQQALVRNLIAAFAADGGDLRFGAADVAIDGLTDSRLAGDGLAGGRPTVTYRDPAGTVHEIECAFVAGCDGDHGVSRTSVPRDALTAYSFDHGIAWLTVLADAPPPLHPLLAVSKSGFAAHFARGPRASRFYLQCPPDDQPADWPADRVWRQLRIRLSSDDLVAGPITEQEAFPLRSLVHEPMSYGQLYLLGDAAHVIAPLGGKGMNLALYDAEVFTLAVRDFTRDGDEEGLRSYSEVCLRRTWNYQEFSRWMTEAAHDAGDGAQADPFRARLARARLDRLFTSQDSARAFAELTAGLA